MTTLGFYRTVIEETGQTNREAVKLGVTAVLGALRDRLTPEESRQAAAQLPRELKAVWLAGEIAGRKADYPKLVTLEGCVEYVVLATASAGGPPTE